MQRWRFGLVGAGGALGAVLRWALLEGGGTSLRPALLVANVLGCFVVGAALAAGASPSATRGRRTLLRDGVGIGFCGGLTTFSTLAVEVAELGRDGRAALGAGYLALSVALGLVAVLGGAALVGRVADLDQPLEGEP